MSAANVNLVMEQGATFRQTITVTSPSGGVYDLTGCTAHLQAVSQYYSTTKVLDLSSSNSGIIVNGTAGTVSLFMSASDTKTLGASLGKGSGLPPIRVLYYDLDITFPSGDTIRVIQGLIKYIVGVTDN